MQNNQKQMFGYTSVEYKKFTKNAWIVLLAFSILYCVLYCGRVNLSYVIPVMIKEEYTRYLYNGNRLETDMIIALEKEELTKQVRVYDRDNHFVGLYEYNQNKKDYKPVKMFL